MSRIGKKPVDLPKGVEVKIEANNHVTVKGPKGTLVKDLAPEMKLTMENNQVIVERPSDLKMMKALHGLTRSLLANMVIGVTEGFKKDLEINGVGYKAAKQGKKLVLALGYSHPVELEDPAGVTSDVPEATKITISGIDKQAVGQYAAVIRSKRPPEPYKGKGIKYVDETIRRKEGKSGKK